MIIIYVAKKGLVKSFTPNIRLWEQIPWSKTSLQINTESQGQQAV